MGGEGRRAFGSALRADHGRGRPCHRAAALLDVLGEGLAAARWVREP